MIHPVNIVLQCTTKEFPFIVRLISTLPNPCTENKEKIHFVVCSDIKFTEIEKEILEKVASNSNFCQNYVLHIESCEQRPSHSVYNRTSGTPIPALPYGRKNGPNQGFFSVLKFAQLYAQKNQALTLLLEPDCIIIEDNWLTSLLHTVQRNPGLIIYGAKPRYEFLPNTWVDEFKKTFFKNNCNRYNGVAIYDTNHFNFSELIDLWSLLLAEITRHVDPLCAFDLIGTTLAGYKEEGRAYYSKNPTIIAKLSNKSYADRFLELYYSQSCEIKKIVDASAFDFSNCINRLESVFQNDQISILHTKLTPSVRSFLNAKSFKPINHSSKDEIVNQYGEQSRTLNDKYSSNQNELDAGQKKMLESLSGFNLSINHSSDNVLRSVNLLKSSIGFIPRYLFTIVTVNFENKGGLLKTINSVKSQSYKNFQYIVIDGGSKDGSLDILNDNVNWVNFIVSEKDDGVYNAMNKGLDLALGQYILYLNSGDSFPNKGVLSGVSDAILSNQEPDIIYGNTRFESNQELWRANKNASEIWKGMICSHQSIFIKTQIAERYRFNESNKIVSDWQMIMNCIIDNSTCIAINFAISEIEPVGISSDFMTRTLERWRLIREKLFDNKSKLKEIDAYYFSLMRSHQEVAQPPAKGILQPNVEANSNRKVDSKLIFLISMPRSGSTLLQRILESCEEVGSCGESWVALPPLAASNPTLSESKYEVPLSNHAFFAACKELDVDTNIRTRAQYEYLKVIYNEFLQKLNKKYFLDKTPRYVHILQELYDLFPAAKFIILTRHPSAIINSYASTWCSKNYTVLANHSSFSFDFYHGLPKLIKFIQKKRKNVFTVTYEDLCENSKVVCEQLSQFLDIDIKAKISQNKSALQRSLGDPKQVNFTSSINSRSVKNLGKQSDFVGSNSYDLICSKIPDFVWNYFQQNSSLLVNNKEKFSFSKTSSRAKKLSHAVIITCFNNQDTIVSAIESALNQTRKADEIIVIDDKSTDNSTSIIKDYISRCKEIINIRLIENNINLGVSATRHKAILATSSDFISTLDGDDTISPFKIDMEMKAIYRSGSEVAFSDIRLLAKHNTQILNTRGYHQKSIESILNMLLTRSVPVPRDLTFSRNIYAKTGGFEPSFNLFEDWMLKQRLAVLAGDKSWAHSGVIGTTYDRRQPGLSNKMPTQLVYAQLLVLSKNIDLFTNYNIDFNPVIAMLSKIDPSISSIFHTLAKSRSIKGSMNDKIQIYLKCMRRSANSLPSYLSDIKNIKIAMKSILLDAQ